MTTTYSPLAWEIAHYAHFRTIDAHDGRTVCAYVNTRTIGGETMGYGHTMTEAMQDLARTLTDLFERE